MNIEYNPDKDKINVFVDIYFDSIKVDVPEDKKDIVKNIIKKDIYRRCKIYGSEYPRIRANKDNYNPNYLIKPENGYLTIEEFFLNRLMFNLREIDLTGALEGNGGEYVSNNKSLGIGLAVLKKIYDESNTLKQKPNFDTIKSKGISKTIHHEIGHALKTVFEGGFKAPLGQGREQDEMYINMLRKLKQTKYSNRIIEEASLINDDSIVRTTGINVNINFNNKNEKKYNYIRSNYSICGDGYTFLDEILNEDEALELTNCNEIHSSYAEKSNNQPTDNYINIYNYTSGYRCFTGYGRCIRSLLGKKASFVLQYGSAGALLKKFDEEYQNVSKEVFGNDKLPIVNISNSLYYIKKTKDVELYRRMDLFVAKAYEQKINKMLNGLHTKEDIASYLEDIETILSRMTKNDNMELEHITIFNNIKERLEEDYSRLNSSGMSI